MDKKLMEHLEKIKDQESNVKIRLFDNKHNRVAYKTLTFKELFLVEAGIKIEWHDLGKKEDKK